MAVRGPHWRPLLILTDIDTGVRALKLVRALPLLATAGRWRSIAYADPIAMATLVFGYLPSLDEGFLEQRDASNSQRLDDVSYIVENATIGTALIGEASAP